MQSTKKFMKYSEQRQYAQGTTKIWHYFPDQVYAATAVVSFTKYYMHCQEACTLSFHTRFFL